MRSLPPSSSAGGNAMLKSGPKTHARLVCSRNLQRSGTSDSVGMSGCDTKPPTHCSTAEQTALDWRRLFDALREIEVRRPE